MLDTGPARIGRLAENILHEAMHATVYIDGQGPFNESAATFVGEGLARELVEQRYGRSSEHARAYREDLTRGFARVEVMLETYEKLDVLYASGRPPTEVLAEKKKLLEAVSRELGAPRLLNNAALIDARTYRRGWAQIATLHHKCGESWTRTIRALTGARASDFDEEQQVSLQPVIGALVQRFCVD